MQGSVNQPAVLNGDAVAADVLLNKTFFSNDPNTRLTGTKDLSNLAAGNIKRDVVIGGVTGNLVAAPDVSLSTATATYFGAIPASTKSLTLVKLAEGTINYNGACNLGASIQSGHASVGIYARAYVDGVAIGTEYYYVGAGTGSFYTSVANGFAGRKVQIYGRTTNAGYNCTVTGAYVMGTLTHPALVT